MPKDKLQPPGHAVRQLLEVLLGGVQDPQLHDLLLESTLTEAAIVWWFSPPSTGYYPHFVFNVTIFHFPKTTAFLKNRKLFSFWFTFGTYHRQQKGPTENLSTSAVRQLSNECFMRKKTFCFYFK